MRRRLLALGIGVLIVYGVLSFGHGTQQCERCGVEREAFCIGPAWFHAWTSDDGRRPWSKLGIAVCDTHSWERSGCWIMPRGISCYFGPRPPE